MEKKFKTKKVIKQLETHLTKNTEMFRPTGGLQLLWKEFKRRASNNTIPNNKSIHVTLVSICTIHRCSCGTSLLGSILRELHAYGHPQTVLEPTQTTTRMTCVGGQLDPLLHP